MTLVNLTPHPVRVYEDDTPDQIEDIDAGVMFELPPTGPPARIAIIDLGRWSTAYDETSGRGTWIEWAQFGHVRDLPLPTPDTTFVVPMVVARDQHHRSDLVFPMHEVRNERGTVVGCKGFGRVC